MFAFAVWNREDRTLTLARDRVGIKPLFWGRFDRLFVFASEIKGLRAHLGWQPQIDPQSLAAYMRWGHVPVSYSIYRGVQKLVPEEYRCVARRRAGSVELLGPGRSGRRGAGRAARRSAGCCIVTYRRAGGSPEEGLLEPPPRLASRAAAGLARGVAGRTPAGGGRLVRRGGRSGLLAAASVRNRRLLATSLEHPHVPPMARPLAVIRQRRPDACPHAAPNRRFPRPVATPPGPLPAPRKAQVRRDHTG